MRSFKCFLRVSVKSLAKTLLTLKACAQWKHSTKINSLNALATRITKKLESKLLSDTKKTRRVSKQPSCNHLQAVLPASIKSMFLHFCFLNCKLLVLQLFLIWFGGKTNVYLAFAQGVPPNVLSDSADKPYQLCSIVCAKRGARPLSALHEHAARSTSAIH